MDRFKINYTFIHIYSVERDNLMLIPHKKDYESKSTLTRN